jgi:hypothetical protein
MTAAPQVRAVIVGGGFASYVVDGGMIQASVGL